MKVAIIGATGLVGKKIIEVLDQRNYPVSELKLFASIKSEGVKVAFREKEIEVHSLADSTFKGLDIAFFAVDVPIAKKYIPEAKKDCIVIDKSSTFRLEKDVPLVVPEVNPESCDKHNNLIANPNCSTIQLVIVLYALQKLAPIKQVLVTSLQSVSGAGTDAVVQLQYEIETMAIGEQDKTQSSFFSHSIGANLIPQIGEIGKDGYAAEEKKIILETRKILNQPDLIVTATCVRVPVFVGHAQAVDITFAHKVTVDEVISILQKSPGIKVFTDPNYPMPIDAADKDAVLVGRIRKHFADEKSISLWIVADNLRKGAATNAVQIAELLLKQ